MHKIKRLLIKIVFLSVVMLTFAMFANAQGAVSYRFLEVVDYANQPVADAAVKVRASCDGGERKTNEKGRLEKGLPIGFGDCMTYGFSVSKPGYFPFEDYFGLSNYSSSREPMKLELLLIPTNAAERRAIGSEQNKRELFAAAKTGDAATVRKLLKAGLSPNLSTTALRGIPSEKNIPVIVFAASSGDGETLREFLAAGADVRRKDEPLARILMTYLSADPFMRRAPETESERAQLINSFEDGAESLIKAGADIFALDEWKTTALMAAAEKGYQRTARLLIEKKVPVDAKDNYGRTALMLLIAASEKSKSRIETANLLLRAGANPNILHPTGYYHDQACQTPLNYAVYNGDPEMITVLLANKADVDLACENGDTALKYAKMLQSQGFFDYRKIIELLEAAGAKK
jgi:ankyrin repeat protein